MTTCLSSILLLNTAIVVPAGEAGALVEVEHTVFEIDPGESVNISCFDAFEWTQANPQSCWLNDFTP